MLARVGAWTVSRLSSKLLTVRSVAVRHSCSKLFVSGVMMSTFDGQGSDLLNQLENILESDNQIDELGFIHSSQFPPLSESANSEQNQRAFWYTPHELGISTQALLPLYKAAKLAFFAALECYNEDYAVAENDVMKHSRALLLLSSDFGTAWNSRKTILSKAAQLALLKNELCLSALVLSHSPKSDQAWSHRRWVIKVIAKRISDVQDILEKESQLVRHITETPKMNYRAWSHLGWLVSYMKSEYVLHELKISKGWSGLHPADNSCFHYRRRLLLGLLNSFPFEQDLNASGCSSFKIQELWMEELDWNKELMKQYTGREALWLHRRFLLMCCIKHTGLNVDISTFVDNEMKLIECCTNTLDDGFDDSSAQVTHATTYAMWLMMKVADPQWFELQEKLRRLDLKPVLKSASLERILRWGPSIMPQ